MHNFNIDLLTDEFVSWAREAGKFGLIKCSSGNLSHRLADGTMLISASGAWLAELITDQVAMLNISDGSLLNNQKPSAEHRFHLSVMKNRPDVDTILHFQSPAATTIACMGISPDYNVIIEVPIYIGAIGHLPYSPPGSQQLADAVAGSLIKNDLVQLANHGQVVCGRSFRETIQKAVFFELACNIILQSNFNSIPLGKVNTDLLKSYYGK